MAPPLLLGSRLLDTMLTGFVSSRLSVTHIISSPWFVPSLTDWIHPTTTANQPSRRRALCGGDFSFLPSPHRALAALISPVVSTLESQLLAAAAPPPLWTAHGAKRKLNWFPARSYFLPNPLYHSTTSRPVPPLLPTLPGLGSIRSQSRRRSRSASPLPRSLLGYLSCRMPLHFPQLQRCPSFANRDLLRERHRHRHSLPGSRFLTQGPLRV